MVDPLTAVMFVFWLSCGAAGVICLLGLVVFFTRRR